MFGKPLLVVWFHLLVKPSWTFVCRICTDISCVGLLVTIIYHALRGWVTATWVEVRRRVKVGKCEGILQLPESSHPEISLRWLEFVIERTTLPNTWRDDDIFDVCRWLHSSVQPVFALCLLRGLVYCQQKTGIVWWQEIQRDSGSRWTFQPSVNHASLPRPLTNQQSHGTEVYMRRERGASRIYCSKCFCVRTAKLRSVALKKWLIIARCRRIAAIGVSLARYYRSGYCRYCIYRQVHLQDCAAPPQLP